MAAVDQPAKLLYQQGKTRVVVFGKVYGNRDERELLLQEQMAGTLPGEQMWQTRHVLQYHEDPWWFELITHLIDILPDGVAIPKQA